MRQTLVRVIPSLGIKRVQNIKIREHWCSLNFIFLEFLNQEPGGRGASRAGAVEGDRDAADAGSGHLFAWIKRVPNIKIREHWCSVNFIFLEFLDQKPGGRGASRAGAVEGDRDAADAGSGHLFACPNHPLPARGSSLHQRKPEVKEKDNAVSGSSIADQSSGLAFIFSFRFANPNRLEARLLRYRLEARYYRRTFAVDLAFRITRQGTTSRTDQPKIRPFPCPHSPVQRTTSEKHRRLNRPPRFMAYRSRFRRRNFSISRRCFLVGFCKGIGFAWCARRRCSAPALRASMLSSDSV